MQNDIRHYILKLEDDILEIEDSIMEFLRPNNDLHLKKALHELKVELKHLSILANGDPLDKTEARNTGFFKNSLQSSTRIISYCIVHNLENKMILTCKKKFISVLFSKSQIH